ncbi:MAG: NYN domain-containing protein [Planctomycetota bacterium]|jgi:uncharacterized LabA/DUF88 family protein|nr:NYN domain-containing protein [Planctomycetota bacterium]MDP6942290.1 NYN domain-containing protein [Planctomycetota bacterium]
MAETETKDLSEEIVEVETEEVVEEQPESHTHESSHPIINQDEVVEDVEREDLEDKYLDLKDEVWRLRRSLNLNPATGQMPNNGGYSSPGGFLKHQRVAVFIDVQNMYHSAKKTFGRNLSYSKMLRHCVGDRRLARAIAYVIDRDGIDQVSFLDHLRYCGMEVKKREVIERMDGSRKAEWELGIAMDMIKIADKVDAIIAVSGNGVFSDVAEIIRAKGTRFECCAFRESMSDLLVRSVDQYHLLSEDHLY